MNQNKDIKKSLEDLKSPSLGTSKETLVSKPELTESKRALDTHISTVVEKDKAMLAEQQKHEGQLTLLRSDLNKKQTKLQEHENQLSVLSFREKDKQTKLEAHDVLLSAFKTNVSNSAHSVLCIILSE